MAWFYETENVLVILHQGTGTILHSTIYSVSCVPH
jgi:hypothetical protein